MTTGIRLRRMRGRITDFEMLTQVGQGGYGSVFLVKHKISTEVSAMKILNKEALQKMGEVKHVLIERDILTTVDSDWLVRLLYAFQDESHIYLGMVSGAIIWDCMQLMEPGVCSWW